MTYKVVPRLKGGVKIRTLNHHMIVTTDIRTSRKMWKITKEHGGTHPIETLIRLELEGRLVKA